MDQLFGYILQFTLSINKKPTSHTAVMFSDVYHMVDVGVVLITNHGSLIENQYDFEVLIGPWLRRHLLVPPQYGSA